MCRSISDQFFLNEVIILSSIKFEDQMLNGGCSLILRFIHLIFSLPFPILERACYFDLLFYFKTELRVSRHFWMAFRMTCFYALLVAPGLSIH